MLTPGSPAPDVSLLDQDGIEHRLSDERGHWVLLYFYSKDDTPGCTKEACGARDSMQDYTDANCTVFGISADSVASHKAFADKYGLHFTLLSDPEKSAINAYGAWGEKTMMGKTYDGILRMSVLIDPEGNIVKVYPKVSPEGHAAEVLGDLRSMQQ